MTFLNREFSQGSQFDEIKRQLNLYIHLSRHPSIAIENEDDFYVVECCLYVLMYYIRYPLTEEFCCFFDWSLQSINRDYYNFSLNRQSCHLKMASWNASWLIEKIQIVITFFLLLNGIKKDAYERIFYVNSLILVLTTTK